MLWGICKKLPTPVLAVLGLVMVITGYWFETIQVESRWLFPLGLLYPGFASSDYFPLFPHLGWFLLGAVLGRTAYRDKKTLLPKVPAEAAPLRFFCWCGTHSLWIYLLHQPVIYGVIEVILLLKK